jgi:imidazolonepropionase-like amidohydrolase
LAKAPQFSRFVVAALSLTALPFPLYLAIQIKTGTWIDVTLMLLVWAAFLLLFWLPLGFWLRPGAGRSWRRALIGLALSVPLGYVTVAVGLWLLTASLLPASLGFHPHSLPSWVAYGAPGPVFFLVVYLTFVLTTHGRRLALVVDGIAIFAFVAYTAGSMGMILTVDHDPWPTAAPATIEIASANLVDTAQGTIVPNQDVTIRDGRIVSILPAGAPAPTGASVIPARGAYLMPGLIDAHVHLLTPFKSIPSLQAGGFDFNYLIASIFGDYSPQREAYLAASVTALRDMGDTARQIFSLRAAVARHQLAGPRIFAVGRLVTSPHGHPVSTIWTPEITRQGAILATNAEQVDQGLDQNFRAGPPDAIKVIHGTIGMAREETTPAVVAAAVQWAHEHRLMCFVHIGTTQEAMDAVAAGADGIEHVATIEMLPPELLGRMVAQHTYADPTFSEYIEALRLTDTPSDRITQLLTEKYALVRQLDAAGVPITVGTDAPLVDYGSGFDDELDQFLKAGFAPAKILHFATVNNAAALAQAASEGEIRPGYEANLVLLRRNPLQDLDAVRHPAWVMVDGTVLFRSTAN